MKIGKHHCPCCMEKLSITGRMVKHSSGCLACDIVIDEEAICEFCNNTRAVERWWFKNDSWKCGACGVTEGDYLLAIKESYA